MGMNIFNAQTSICFAFVALVLLISAVPSMAEPVRHKLGYHQWFSSELEDSAADEIFSMIHEVGDWTLFGVNWAKVADEYGGDFGRYEDLVASAQANNLNIILQIVGTPVAHRAVELADYYTSAPVSNASAEWAQFCKDVIDAFYPDVTHYEIGNEPNTNHYYKLYHPETGVSATGVMSYNEYLHVASNAMRERVVELNGTSEVKIITGGLASTDGTKIVNVGGHDRIEYCRADDYLSGIISYKIGNNLVDLYDVVGYHPYGNFLTHPEDPLDTCADGVLCPEYSFMFTVGLNNVLIDEDTLNDVQREIWGTECGPPIGPVNSEAQAFWAERYVEQWMEWGFTGPLLWWNLRKQDIVNDNHDFRGWGVVNRDWSVEPAYERWIEFSQLNGKVLHVGSGDLGPSSFDTFAEAVEKIRESPQAGGSWVIKFYKLAEPHHITSASFADIPIDTLSLIGVGGERWNPEPAVEHGVVLDGLFGSAFLEIGTSTTLVLQNLNVEHVYNSDAQRNGVPGVSVRSLITSHGGEVLLDNCRFLDITTGGTGNVDPGGVITFAAPVGLSGAVTLRNCVFSDCVGPESGVLAATRAGASVEHCTFHRCTSTENNAQALRFIDCGSQLTGSLFTGTDDPASSAFTASGGTTSAAYCLFDANVWAARVRTGYMVDTSDREHR